MNKKMSRQTNHSSWLSPSMAKRKYFLTSEELATLPCNYPEISQKRRGKPVKLYNSKDLKQKAEEKFGEEEFQARLRYKKLKKKGRMPTNLVAMKEKEFKRGNKQRIEQEIPSKDKDIESLCSLTKKCEREQLEQLVVLLGKKHESFISAINEVKNVALLPRSKFQLVEPKLAKLLSLDTGSEVMQPHQESITENAIREYNQIQMNMALEGKWKLRVGAPSHKKGEEGLLEITLYGSGLSAGGDIFFKDSNVSGDIERFKKFSSIEQEAMTFETRSRFRDKWSSGALRVSVSRDMQGLLVSGSFWPGYKEQETIASTFQFSGRKVDSGDE